MKASCCMGFAVMTVSGAAIAQLAQTCWVTGPAVCDGGDCLEGSYTTCGGNAVTASSGHSMTGTAMPNCVTYAAKPGSPFILAPCAGGPPAPGYVKFFSKPCGTTTSDCCWSDPLGTTITNAPGTVPIVVPTGPWINCPDPVGGP